MDIELLKTIQMMECLRDITAFYAKKRALVIRGVFPKIIVTFDNEGNPIGIEWKYPQEVEYALREIQEAEDREIDSITKKTYPLRRLRPRIM